MIIFCLAANSILFSQDSIFQITESNLDSVLQIMKEQERLQASEQRAIMIKKLKASPSDSVFELQIENLYFRQLPDISRFKFITTIDAEKNELKSIKKSVFKGDSLHRINLSGNQMKHIRFPKNNTITSLILNENNFRRIPPSIKKLKNLQYLEMNNNLIRGIPRWLPKNSKLTSLDLNYNKLRFDKKAVRGLNNINSLLLGGNELTELPDNIGELKNLRKLNLGKNKLSNLPGSFKELDSLTNLIFYQNEFAEIPTEIGYLKNLVELDFYYNNITEIPDEIGGLTKLKQLFLSFNQIKILPDTLRNLTNLKYVFLHHNQLMYIPKWVGSMTKMERMDLSYNHIISIPDLSGMKSLSELDIQNNVIENFPWELLEMPNMKLLIVKNNNFILTGKEEAMLKEWKNEVDQDSLIIIF